jgi:ribosomal protein S8
MRKVWVLSIIMNIFVFGCATTGVTPEKTQLQIREFQTRTYETNDTKMIMKAMLNVLQDEGFIVKNAVMDLGLLSAEKTIDIESKGEAFLSVLFLGAQATWKKASLIECTANVSEYGNQSRVRVNFQVKVLDNKGGIIEVKQIEEEKYYQDFFSKVDKGIFIQKEKL